MLALDDVRIGIIGLGYVGLPLALEFGKRYPAVGFDISERRICETGTEATDSTQHDPAGLSRLPAQLSIVATARTHVQVEETADAITEAVDSPEMHFAVAEFPQDPRNWSELEVRTFHRLLLERVCPAGMPRRLATCGPRRTLAYLGKGEVLGERGTLRDMPRNATCIAYDHPDSGTYQRIRGAVHRAAQMMEGSR